MLSKWIVCVTGLRVISNMFGYKTKQQLIDEGYEYYGSLWGVPCYIADIESGAPVVTTANFIPQWILDVADWIIFTMDGIIDPYGEPPMFKIKLKGKIVADNSDS